ncbi:MAG: hypothetical protein KKD44_28145 [Proteobacteria bacterium]|nr:hypothetical protein [Pseudomonadota bacterium]
MARIVVFKDKTFVSTGQNIITEDYTLDIPSKCTAIINAVAQGDAYARTFEVYSDGILKHKATIINSVNEHVNMGFLDAGRHVIGIKINTSVGMWNVNGEVISDTIELPEITPPLIYEDPMIIEPARDLTGPMTLSPPISDAPMPQAPYEDKTGWAYLLKPSTWRIPTQAEIDSRNRDTNRARAIADTGIIQVTHLEAFPKADWLQSNSAPLSVQAVNDRLKDISAGSLPNLDFPSGVIGSPEYGPTELNDLTGGLFAAHKDNFGRDVVSFGSDFSMEPGMILLGMGLAALAAAAFFKRDDIAQAIKKVKL